MQLDSHRRQLSFTADLHRTVSVVEESSPVTIDTTASAFTPAASTTMPCPRSCPRSKPATYTADDGTEMQAWHSVRREQLRNMRSMVKRVVFYMALIEAIRVGPDALVFAGRNGYPERGAEDFGIAYYAGYVLSYLYLCVFTIVWQPLFSWWVPSTPADSSTGKKIDKFVVIMQQINMVLLPISVALSVGEYLFWTVTTLIYVDARPVDSFQLPKNTQKNWLARVMLLVGIFVSTTFGYGVFEILGQTGLARVKCLEYMIIVVPIQINIGVLLGSVMQWKMEKRVERKAMVLGAAEVGTGDEKQALLAV